MSPAGGRVKTANFRKGSPSPEKINVRKIQIKRLTALLLALTLLLSLAACGSSGKAPGTPSSGNSAAAGGGGNAGGNGAKPDDKTPDAGKEPEVKEVPFADLGHNPDNSRGSSRAPVFDGDQMYFYLAGRLYRCKLDGSELTDLGVTLTENDGLFLNLYEGCLYYATTDSYNQHKAVAINRFDPATGAVEQLYKSEQAGEVTGLLVVDDHIVLAVYNSKESVSVIYSIKSGEAWDARLPRDSEYILTAGSEYVCAWGCQAATMYYLERDELANGAKPSFDVMMWKEQMGTSKYASVNKMYFEPDAITILDVDRSTNALFQRYEFGKYTDAPVSWKPTKSSRSCRSGLSDEADEIIFYDGLDHRFVVGDSMIIIHDVPDTNHSELYRTDMWNFTEPEKIDELGAYMAWWRIDQYKIVSYENHIQLSICGVYNDVLYMVESLDSERELTLDEARELDVKSNFGLVRVDGAGNVSRFSFS